MFIKASSDFIKKLIVLIIFVAIEIADLIIKI
jgi:hypothetical protein